MAGKPSAGAPASKARAGASKGKEGTKNTEAQGAGKSQKPGVVANKSEVKAPAPAQKRKLEAGVAKQQLLKGGILPDVTALVQHAAAKAAGAGAGAAAEAGAGQRGQGEAGVAERGFAKVVTYACTARCRRTMLLDHFDESLPAGGCQGCDYCQDPQVGST